MARESRPSPPARLRAWAVSHKRATGAIVVGALAAAVGAFLLWLHLRTFVSTDDAQVDGDISSISSRVNGVVTRVHVVENQYVHAGDLLVELDPAPFRVALSRARADLAQAEAQAEAQRPEVPITSKATETDRATLAADVQVATAELGAARRDVESAQARVLQAEAQDRLARIDYLRYKELRANDAVPEAEFDRRTANADAARAEDDAAQAALAAAKHRVDQRADQVRQARSRLLESVHNGPRQVAIQRANVDSRAALVKAAQAEVEQARLDLGYTRIVAPVSGIIGRKTVEVGNHVEPGQQILVIVQVDRLWITANFKETDLARMRVDQRARVSVDAYGTTYDASVQSLAGATGSRFSLFPPENATGNFVKVVQRLPVRVRLLAHQPGWQRLRPGMSVEARVYVR